MVGVRPLSESIAKLAPVAAPSATPAGGVVDRKGETRFQNDPIRREELMPYQEFLVGFVYDVEEVIAGEYGEKQILVMHPA
jgi:hypothetical protein